MQIDSVRVCGLGYSHSEDCLTINVIRPSNYTEYFLPVGVYKHGGAYSMGGSPDPRNNMSDIVESSVEAGVPIMAVSINYRLGALGFLGGTEVVKAGAANLGFRDQRLALRWIQGGFPPVGFLPCLPRMLTFLTENIKAFGGDPRKVTIWGNSAYVSYL